MARLLRALVVVCGSVYILAPLFHLPDGRFMTTGLGDWGDPNYINYLLEHWHHALRRLKNPASPPMFHPTRNTLSYSVGLALYAPFYILVRSFLEPLPAYTVALFLVVETGVLCLYVIFRSVLRLTFVESLVLTAFFALSPNVLSNYTSIWSQVLSVFLIPPVLLIGLASGRLTHRWLRYGTAGVAGLLTTLLFVQDFYTGWLASLLAALLAIGLTIVNPRGVRRWLTEAWQADRPRALSFAAGAAAGTVLFLAIYWPMYRANPGFPDEQLMSALKRVYLARWRHPREFAREIIAYESTSPFIAALIVMVTAWFPRSGVDRRMRWFAVWFSAVAAIVLVSAVHFHWHSVWRDLFRYVPGAAAIRDPKRIIYSFQLTTALVAGVYLTRLRGRWTLRLALLALLAWLIWQKGPEPFVFARSTAEFDRWVKTPIAVDAGCRSFFIRPASAEYIKRWHYNWSLYGLDAAFIALRHDVPTLNGYSAWTPPVWDLQNPEDTNYLTRVDEWIALHNLDNVCALDIEERTMKPY